ncbi:MAG: amidase [Betaproteobacteria bacterium]|nr:amidase [Betaproteobacteria bacterium]
MHRLDAVAAVAALAAGRISAEELTRACLERIAARESDVRAWAWWSPEQAIAEARARDRDPRRGLLHGIPIAVKDIIDTADMPTEYGTPIYQGHRPRWDAACVAAAREQGAVVLGKTVTTELANRHPAGTRNPHNLAHTPGGSSSGSGAAVADCMVPLAFGSQTGGSLIRPAAYCGIVGYKPTFNFINPAGVKPLSSAQDTVGVYGRTVPDAALFGAAVIGYAPLNFDVKSATAPRVGIYRTPQWPLAEPACAAAFDAAAARLAHAGARVTQVAAPAALNGIVAAAGIINDYETYRALAYERVHHAARLSPTLNEKLANAARVGRAQYLASLDTARACRALIDDLLADYDVLIAPSATGEAPAGLASIGPAAFQQMWTILHNPAISIPVFTGPQGLPMGAQVIGPRGQDERALLCAHWVHQALT